MTGRSLLLVVAMSGCVAQGMDGELLDRESPSPKGGAEMGETLAEAPRISDFEVAYFSRTRNIPLGEAQYRLTQQARVDDFSRVVVRDMGEGFGGIWIDVHDGDRLKLGVTADATGDMSELASRAAASVGISEYDLDIVPTRHSMAELEAAIEWLGDELGRVDPNHDLTLSAGVLPDLNMIEMQTPMTDTLSRGQRDFVKAAKARFGDMLMLVEHAGRLVAQACTYPNCDPPLRAGISIFSPTWGCTGGFIARSRSSSNLFQFTAGHCVTSDSEVFRAFFANGSTHVIGSPTDWSFGENGDMAIIRINNVSGWNPKNWVYNRLGSEEHPITATGGSTKGMQICKSGAVAETICGTVLGIGEIATYSNVMVKNLAHADYWAAFGDSGGPVYSGNKARGIHVAGWITVPPYLSNSTYYQGIHGAEDDMNVDVLTAPP